MATQTVSSQVREGAEAFIDMMRAIQAQAETDLERHADFLKTGRDVRDYRAVGMLVDAALKRNLFATDAERAQGFLRALSDLLCRNVDGCGCDPEDWDPIRNTAFAYGEGLEVHRG